MNTVGLVAFAFVGSTKAIGERFDLFGVAIVGLVTAFAGGTTRDILVDRVPLTLSSPVEIILGMLGVVLESGSASPSTPLPTPTNTRSRCLPTRSAWPRSQPQAQSWRQTPVSRGSAWSS
jgi:hypothetical protein